MTSLLEIKEKIVGFYKNFEYPVQIIGKFILAMLAFSYINNELGYFEALTGTIPMLFFISHLCRRADFCFCADLRAGGTAPSV